VIVAVAIANQSWRRVDMRMILHRFRFRRSVLILSCAIFLLAVLCQFPPSTSIAILSEGNARSILNLSNANEGIGFHPSFFRTLASADSYLLIFAFRCFPSALLQRSSCERFFPVMIARLADVIRICSAYVLRFAIISAVSEIDLLWIPYLSNHRYITLRETFLRVAISCAVIRFRSYISNNKSREGFSFISESIINNNLNCNMNGTRSFAPYMGEL
jgi:hypothetical protein